MRAGLVLMAIVAGCGPTPVEGADAMGMADMATGGDLASSQTLDVQGKIVGLDGAGLGGVAVSLCTGATCSDAMTGTQGEYAFHGVSPDFHTLRAKKPGATDYAELVFPIYLSAQSNPRLLPLVLPKVGTAQPIAQGPQSLAIDETLTIALDGNALTLPAGGAPRELAGVRIPSAQFPDFCVPSARVLAMWAFAPTFVKSASPIGVTIADSLGLQAGAIVRLIAIDADTGRPSIAADAQVGTDEESIETMPSAGLGQLGWLLVAVVSGDP